MSGRKTLVRLACCFALIAALTGATPSAAQAATIRQRIVTQAEREVGYTSPGHFCTMFGPCELWCSLFLTWVWERAGVDVPRLAFTGYLYDWSHSYTYVLPRRATPQPGDAVLFGTGPWSVASSVHVGIVEAVYPGYLVTIEGDVFGKVRRFVVPVNTPQRIGEPGPIYAFASPVPAAAAPARARAAPARARAAAAFRPGGLTQVRLTAHSASAHAASAETATDRRLLRTIASLRAFQHMPYRTSQYAITWTGVDLLGRVEVRVASAQPLAAAQAFWAAFLRRYADAGHAYVVTLAGPGGAVPVELASPAISGDASVGQTLTVAPGQWSPTPTAIAYQWQDCDTSGMNCVAIPGATGSTYTLTASDAGDTVRVVEIAYDVAGASAPAPSTTTGVVTSLPFGLNGD